MGGGVIILIYKIFKKIFPNLRWTFKYRIFRMEYKQNDVKWCMQAVEKELDEAEVKKFLLLNGKSVRRTNEIQYVFNKVQNKIKGGKTNNGKLRKRWGN